jgi:hypothetical protein
VAHGCWSTPAGQDTVLRLKTIHDAVAVLIDEHAPDAVALEESYVGADARIALSVGQARGAVLVAAANAGVACREFVPRVGERLRPPGRGDARSPTCSRAAYAANRDGALNEAREFHVQSLRGREGTSVPVRSLTR